MKQTPPFLPHYSNPTKFPGLDWNFIGSCDPILIRETKDFRALQQFISSFMNSTLNPNDKAILSHPLSYKLIQLLQITTQYMFDCQTELSSTISDLEDKNELYKQKIRLLVKAQNRSSALLRDAYHDFEKCPVCGKKFKAMRYVDRHMQSCHSEHLLAWKSLRINNPIDPSEQVKELQDEITYLKDMLNKQTRQFMDSIQNFNQRLEAQKRDFKRKKKTVPTIEHIEIDPTHSDSKVNYPPIISENYRPNPLGQEILHVEQLTDSSGSDYENIDDACNKIEKKAGKNSVNIHLGLGANYITPKQVEDILKYNNPAYRQFYQSAKAQLEKDIPMPDKQKKKPPKSFFVPQSSTTTSTSTPQSSLFVVSSGSESSSQSSKNINQRPTTSNSNNTNTSNNNTNNTGKSSSNSNRINPSNEVRIRPETYSSDYNAESASDEGNVSNGELMPISSDEDDYNDQSF
ncbi:hypothetical protein TRFO_38342 [Tritrichomonas foetus]|uniref:C2H2-type domain-containing protein n=1 Tax=Tritrichomonas foetus TaxID=1144522 RepID=A0A1J4J8R2_9EUKA|nr:hypothetical protein TRFO_38342 [Tritrichomonas foetus]|eukprot:OHS95528.1 hypothetical protein TRFO_38342 [Tritrichomonas foetus]